MTLQEQAIVNRTKNARASITRTSQLLELYPQLAHHLNPELQRLDRAVSQLESEIGIDADLGFIPLAIWAIGTAGTIAVGTLFYKTKKVESEAHTVEKVTESYMDLTENGYTHEQAIEILGDVGKKTLIDKKFIWAIVGIGGIYAWNKSKSTQ